MKSPPVLLVNPTACGGKGAARWQKLQSALPFPTTILDISASFDSMTLDRALQAQLQKGKRHFVAVGGDGTCNVMVNSLLRASAACNIPSAELIFGAIGTGSSNDFHKPISSRIAGFPCRMNFESTLLTDLCWWAPKDGPRTYFLLNASLGLTAEANGYFNHHLRIVKRISTPLAILWAALRSLLLYRNLSLRLCLYGNRNVTNLAIVRNQHFSGNFAYPTGEKPDSGHFHIYLCDNLSKWESLRTLRDFFHNRFFGSKLHQCRGTTFYVHSETPFWVEADGEVSQQSHITFGIDRGRIQLCS